jgi:hypothetical protein
VTRGEVEQDWVRLTERLGLASPRLIGWIYWDPRAIELYTQLGIPNGFGYYVTSRAAPLFPAGPDVVAAAYYSIHPGFIALSAAAALEHATWQQIYDVRNRAVADGLRAFVPEIVDELGALGPSLWTGVDALPESGRVMFAAHRSAPRVDDPAVSAWLAVNCLREWRGDTHFALLVAENISRVEAGVLHDAHLNYGGWIARSRGADDAALAAAFESLQARGLADGDRVTPDGERLRQHIENRTNEISATMWKTLGRETSERLLAVIEPVGERLLKRIDDTAGPNWMPAARTRRS